MNPVPADGLTRILAAMPADLGEDEQVDWNSLRSTWRMTFPSDYMAFMVHYGAGTIDDSASVLAPDTPGQCELGGMAGETRTAHDLWHAEPAPVLAWGVTVAADIICWKTVHTDPDRWPVVVWRRQSSSPQWLEFDMGMADFLCGMFFREFDECPLSDATLWGSPTPRFISNRQQQRLLGTGVDPWTGEPDPYAGLSFDD